MLKSESVTAIDAINATASASINAITATTQAGINAIINMSVLNDVNQIANKKVDQHMQHSNVNNVNQGTQQAEQKKS